MNTLRRFWTITVLDKNFQDKHRRGFEQMSVYFEIYSSNPEECIKTNINCSQTLTNLTLNGRFAIKSKADLIYQDAMTSSGHQFVGTMEELIENIIYPTFERLFSKRNIFLSNNSIGGSQEVANILNVNDCLKHGPDCEVALHVLDLSLIHI